MTYEAASSPLHSHLSSDHDFASAPTHATFNANAATPLPAYPDIRGHLDSAARHLRANGDELTLEQLDDAKRKTDQIGTLILNNKAALLLDSMINRISELKHPEAPQFGHQFINAMNMVGCNIEVDDKLLCRAAYASYSYASHQRGFVNKIGLNPSRVEDEDEFTLSTSHEFFHAFQKHVAPALHLSPFNPDTRRIVHPLDWIMLEAACERDAYTKQAMISALMCKDNPGLAAKTRAEVVTANEFSAVLQRSNSLADAVVATALQSLHKPTSRSQPHGRTFVNNYQDVALGNFAAGMAMREKEGETDHTFMRLNLRHLWQVGNYGVGPNSLGERVMEPLIAVRQPLLPDAQKKLKDICEKYNIPPLEQCEILGDEHVPSMQRSTQSPRSHAPAYAYAAI